MDIPWIQALNVFSDTPKDISLHFAYAILDFLKPVVTFENTSGTFQMFIQNNKTRDQTSPENLIFFLQITLFNIFNEELERIETTIQKKYSDHKKLVTKQSKQDISEKQKKNNSDKIRLLSFDIESLKELILVTKKNIHLFYKNLSTNSQINELLYNIKILCQNEI
jgi:hypothetical protein